MVVGALVGDGLALLAPAATGVVLAAVLAPVAGLVALAVVLAGHGSRDGGEGGDDDGLDLHFCGLGMFFLVLLEDCCNDWELGCCVCEVSECDDDEREEKEDRRRREAWFI